MYLLRIGVIMASSEINPFYPHLMTEPLKRIGMYAQKENETNILEEDNMEEKI
jgi:hypothetical protein